MKVPQLLQGARHRVRQPRAAERRPVRTPNDVMPQDAWCESQCRETYPRGSADHQSCLQACWRSD